MSQVDHVDVHQHLWPEEFLDRLRARTKPPYLRGWTLHTAGEPAFPIDPHHHDVATRVAADQDAGVSLACLSLSAPLGVELLPRPEAQPLIDAWHRGALALPEHFRVWASVPAHARAGSSGRSAGGEPHDVVAVDRLLAHERVVGLQLPATELLSPAAWERRAGLLLAAERAGKPVLVHPGPADGPETSRVLAGPLPSWWAPVVDYTAQLQSAWWAWHAVGGRGLFPGLRVVFAAAAGLAPLQAERHALRGGERAPVDPDLFVDTSGTGPRALEAVVRALGVDVLVLGSDRPYAEPLTELLGEAATRALRVTNPARLLTPTPVTEGGASPWAVAS